ncbi:MAG TPA: hypothetical protein VF548_09160 [Allosphingosinicella sp.]
MPVSRLIRWLTLIALFMAPLAMIEAGPAMAHGHAVAGGRCSKSDEKDHPSPAAPADCMIACAGVLLHGDSDLDRPRPARSAEPATLAYRLDGLSPEAATPPPRCS